VRIVVSYIDRPQSLDYQPEPVGCQSGMIVSTCQQLWFPWLPLILHPSWMQLWTGSQAHHHLYGVRMPVLRSEVGSQTGVACLGSASWQVLLQPPRGAQEAQFTRVGHAGSYQQLGFPSPHKLGSTIWQSAGFVHTLPAKSRKPIVVLGCPGCTLTSILLRTREVIYMLKAVPADKVNETAGSRKGTPAPESS
jgi:hypothetical protein